MLFQVSDGYEGSLTVSARQFEANGQGEEAEVPLHTWFDVALFPQSLPLKGRLRCISKNICLRAVPTL